MNLTLEEVSKRYRPQVWGLRDFSLEVEPGVWGLLGPNGAGKSTLKTLIATITQPTIGCIKMDRRSLVLCGSGINVRLPDRTARVGTST